MPTKNGSQGAVRRLVLLLLAVLLLALCALAPRGEREYRIDAANRANFTELLGELLAACEQPSAEDEAAIAATLRAIGAVNADDLALASSIAGHWKRVYLDPGYRLRLYRGGERAEELSDSAIPDRASHAFVVLGYELENGEMRDELRARCDAAAAAARAFPRTVLICSGGATGANNPAHHTEAGLMKDYLVRHRGIDPSRILIDERAMTTAENALNSLEIMRAHGVRSMTVVTSAYHQRWGQVLYHASAELWRMRGGYEIEIVDNYCCDVPAPAAFRGADARIAVSQLAQILGIPAPRRA